jgi:LacI family transcriptional regulator, galactose operon repressor
VSGAQSLSLREVAFLAGVAASSVSRVLSGHPDVSPAMRARVMAVVDQLGYEPDLLASSFRRGATMSVALVVSDIASPPAAETALGAETRLREAGYTMLVTSSHGSAQLDAAAVNAFRRRRVDGLLLTLSDDADRDTLAQIERLTAPYVLVDGDPSGAPGASAVVCDHAGGVDRAVEHLRGLGHRRIGLVAGPPTARANRERRRAFEAACAGLGIDAVVEAGGADAATGHAATARMLDRPARPTAVVAGSIDLLPGVLRALGAGGLRIPADVSLVAFDDAPLLGVLDPAPAVISCDRRRTGQAAARLLLDRIAGEPPAATVVPARFDPRAGCGPAPAA